MSGNYLTPKFWYTGYTGCTILVHRVHRVHHFGTQGAPFWYTGYTGCTILVHRVHHFGTQGAPFWYTGCTILVHRVHHFGTQGAPSRVRHPPRITSQFPKNEPDPGNTPPDHHGTFEKSPTKPPPGLTARLSSPHTQTGLRRRRQRTTTVTAPTPAGAVIHLEAPNDHHTSRISNDGRTPTTHHESPPRTGSTDLFQRAQPDSPRSSRPNPDKQHVTARLNRQGEMSDPRHRDTRQVLHAAAPIRNLLTITLQNILTPSHGHYRPPPLHGPALRAGPNHPPSSVPQTRAPSLGGPALRAGPNRP